MQKRRGKTDAPVRIGEPLGRVLERAAPRGRRLLTVLDRWRSMVSPETLRHARPTTIRRNVLFLTVTDPVWMSELTYFVPRFLEVLNEALPGDQALASIRMRIGTLRPLEAPSSAVAAPEPADTSELSGDMKRRLGRIPDPDLREQMTRIAAKLGGKKGKSPGDPTT